MDHYIDITLLPDPEFNETTLMNALFAKFHRALVATGHGKIAVSFPRPRKHLGDCLRLHGEQTMLQQLMVTPWLKGLSDYTSVSEISPVPANCEHRTIKRVQVKSNAERLRRRSIKKGWLTPEQAEERITIDKEQTLKQSFIQVKSHSSGQVFRLFIDQSNIEHSPRPGEFSAYGLSKGATVPWF